MEHFRWMNQRERVQAVVGLHWNLGSPLSEQVFNYWDRVDMTFCRNWRSFTHAGQKPCLLLWARFWKLVFGKGWKRRLFGSLRKHRKFRSSREQGSFENVKDFILSVLIYTELHKQFGQKVFSRNQKAMCFHFGSFKFFGFIYMSHLMCQECRLKQFNH